MVRGQLVAPAAGKPRRPRSRPGDDGIAAARSGYRKTISRLETTRRRLAKRYRTARSPHERRGILAVAAQTLERVITRGLLPAWLGTPWAYSGTTEVPGRGKIACGYLVSTVLRDAGFRVPRARLAQQAAERIIRTLSPERWIWRFSRRPVAQVVARVRKSGSGLYLIGLDNHVGFLWYDGSTVRFCHASVLGGTTTCEPALTSPAMVSGYHVVGKLFGPAQLRRWLTGASIRLARR